MLFAEYDRCQYARSPLVEVICQLRFPAILTINTKEPAEFQEAVRHGFPRYAARKEQLPPKVTGLGHPQSRSSEQRPLSSTTALSLPTACGKSISPRTSSRCPPSGTPSGRTLPSGWTSLWRSSFRCTSPPSSSAWGCGM